MREESQISHPSQTLVSIQKRAKGKNNIIVFKDTISHICTHMGLETIWMHHSNLEDDVSGKLCDSIKGSSYTSSYFSFFEVLGITADCRNDVFDAKVRCPCCSYCTNLSPTFEGECADSITFKIDHKDRNFIGEKNSDGMIWKLVDDSTGEKIIYDGPFSPWAANMSLYNACVSYAGCYSLELINVSHTV